MDDGLPNPKPKDLVQGADKVFYPDRRPSHLKVLTTEKFVEAGETIAKLLEDAGTQAEVLGTQRKQEFYRAAQNIRDKTRAQSEEAANFVSILEGIKTIIQKSD